PTGSAGYDSKDVAKGGNGYVPIPLQYGPYTASLGREKSIAAGDPVEPSVTNRSYKNKTVTASNFNDLKTVLETKAAMKGKPVVVVMTLSKPVIPAEFEQSASAIVACFSVQDQALLDILTGQTEPSGLLPFQLPANMKTVELQNEDIPHDMICYIDADHHTYDFGFGMNWRGEIHDARTSKYVNAISKPKFSLKGQTLAIMCSTPDTKIYYTLDGSTPAFSKENEYTKPFAISGNMVVRAIAKKYGQNNSVLVEYQPKTLSK
ncbi:MAG: hypothetical protein EOP44_03245, partial [Sphingobacteriaceae bacterium]